MPEAAGVHTGESGERSGPDAGRNRGKRPRAAGADRRPVAAGWAEQNRVKVERAYPPGP